MIPSTSGYHSPRISTQVQTKSSFTLRVCECVCVCVCVCTRDKNLLRVPPLKDFSRLSQWPQSIFSVTKNISIQQTLLLLF